MKEEYYFKQGADAMQSKITAFLVTMNLFDVAQAVIRMEMPIYQEREQVVINHPPPKMWSTQNDKEDK